MTEKIHATTVLCVRKGPPRPMASDGQVTLGNTASSATAKSPQDGRRARLGRFCLAVLPTESPCLNGSKPNSKNTTNNRCAPPSSWPKTGAPIAPCVDWKP